MLDQLQFDGFSDDYEVWDEIDEICEAEKSAAEIEPRWYWAKAIEVINIWAKYQSLKKLYVNATHDETKHRVRKVIDGYYGGRVERVRNHEQELSLAVDRLLNEFAMICDMYGVEKISRDWLYRKLESASHYNSYRRKCERRMNKSKPAISLREI